MLDSLSLLLSFWFRFRAFKIDIWFRTLSLIFLPQVLSPFFILFAPVDLEFDPLHRFLLCYTPSASLLKVFPNWCNFITLAIRFSRWHSVCGSALELLCALLILPLSSDEMRTISFGWLINFTLICLNLWWLINGKYYTWCLVSDYKIYGIL